MNGSESGLDVSGEGSSTQGGQGAGAGLGAGAGGGSSAGGADAQPGMSILAAVSLTCGGH